MDSIPAGAKTLCLRSSAGTDATLHLDVPVELAGVDYDVVIVVRRAGQGAPQAAPSTYLLLAEVEREGDGRWFAEIPEVPGAFAHGRTRDEAAKRATALALRVLADRLEGVQEPGLDDGPHDQAR